MATTHEVAIFRVNKDGSIKALPGRYKHDQHALDAIEEDGEYILIPTQQITADKEKEVTEAPAKPKRKRHGAAKD